MKLSKIASLLMAPVLTLSLAACSAPKDDASDAASGDAQIAELVAQKPADAEEAAELFQQLMQKENEIFASDSALWEKVFLAANKDEQWIRACCRRRKLHPTATQRETPHALPHRNLRLREERCNLPYRHH